MHPQEVNNNGDILTIDETTGDRHYIRFLSNLFDGIKSISIDPNSGAIYGWNMHEQQVRI